MCHIYHSVRKVTSFGNRKISKISSYQTPNFRRATILKISKQQQIFQLASFEHSTRSELPNFQFPRSFKPLWITETSLPFPKNFLETLPTKLAWTAIRSSTDLRETEELAKRSYTSPLAKTGSKVEEKEKDHRHRPRFTCIHEFYIYHVFEGWASRGFCTSRAGLFLSRHPLSCAGGSPPQRFPFDITSSLFVLRSGCCLPSSVMPASAWLCLVRCLRHPRLSP